MSDDITQIFDRAASTIRAMLFDAYEAGRQIGRKEAAAEFKAKIADFLEQEPKAKHVVVSVTGVSAEAQTSRAAPGSVKPAIMKLVQDSGGMSLRDIEQATGFKYNSVRGTLWQLQQEDKIVKDGDIYRAVSQKNEPAGTPSKDAPTGSALGLYD